MSLHSLWLVYTFKICLCYFYILYKYMSDNNIHTFIAWDIQQWLSVGKLTQFPVHWLNCKKNNWYFKCYSLICYFVLFFFDIDFLSGFCTVCLEMFGSVALKLTLVDFWDRALPGIAPAPVCCPRALLRDSARGVLSSVLDDLRLVGCRFSSHRGLRLFTMAQ